MPRTSTHLGTKNHSFGTGAINNFLQGPFLTKRIHKKPQDTQQSILAKPSSVTWLYDALCLCLHLCLAISFSGSPKKSQKAMRFGTLHRHRSMRSPSQHAERRLVGRGDQLHPHGAPVIQHVATEVLAVAAARLRRHLTTGPTRGPDASPGEAEASWLPIRNQGTHRVVGILRSSGCWFRFRFVQQPMHAMAPHPSHKPFPPTPSPSPTTSAPSPPNLEHFSDPAGVRASPACFVMRPK